MKLANNTVKQLPAEVATIGVWGLHISSYLIAAIPFLQVTSLVLAIVVSLITLNKLKKKKMNS